ncbi:hypothetical protein [Pseudomonas sp. TWP3-1]|uniref:hypothetical protein n=1 Tax=Pseudomonas sp. TWP3-1 TaxID=2804631 RepID=UPI003CE70209
MNIMEVIRAPKVRRGPRSVKAQHGVASVVARAHRNNPLIAPFIMVYATVLAFFAGCV